MWVVKLKFWHPNSLSITLAQKFKVTKLVFPLNTVIKDGKVTLTAGHLILGDDKQVEKYFKALLKEKRIDNIERQGNFVVYSFTSPETESHLQMYYSPSIFLVKPVTVKADDFQYIELAS